MLYDAKLLAGDYQDGEILELNECCDLLNEGKYHVGGCRHCAGPDPACEITSSILIALVNDNNYH